jgi:molecular chaperone GrpE
MSIKDNEETLEESQLQEETNTADTNEQDELTTEEQLHADLAKEKDKFMRLFAEFENYKKRTSKERIDFFKTASQDTMTALLPILDDFERAMLHSQDDKEAEAMRQGVLLIYNKLVNTLNQKGMELIQVEAGDVFDADMHEAITQVEAPSDDLKGKIVEVVEKGYKLGERIIRFPKVIIGR